MASVKWKERSLSCIFARSDKARRYNFAIIKINRIAAIFILFHISLATSKATRRANNVLKLSDVEKYLKINMAS